VILVILFLAWIYLTNQNPLNSITTFGTFAFAAIRLLPSINSILNSISQLRYFQNSVNQLYDQVVDSKNSNNSIDKNQINAKSDLNTLKFESLSFKYPTQKNYILNKVNLEIRKGDKICVLGDSGSGKSTLIDIVSYNNNIEYNFEDIRYKIAYIPQNIVLLDDTIKNNIALGVEEKMIDINKIYESISKAKLQEFIENKEHGINDIIGDKGMRISGGQRQRIALARAFYFDKEFLILDEATSALDEKTESEILDTLFEDTNSQTTIIIISHRHHVQNYCNKVFKLYKGDLKQIK
jgi:ABC-type multidrug transport system fused ATPase/permease subunit